MNIDTFSQAARRCLVGAAFLLLALGIGACTEPQGNAADGERWYSMHSCYACHGYEGDDGGAPQINNPEMSFRHFKQMVRNAGSPIMPKYPEDKISDQDVADIYAWLKTK